MALDFHNIYANEYLFGLDDSKYANIEVIVTEFKNRSGIFVDPYGDTKLTVAHQKTIVKIIEDFINKTDLNVNKQQTIDIIEFRALMNYFSDKGIDIIALGD